MVFVSELQVKQKRFVTYSFIIIFMVIFFGNVKKTLYRTNDLGFWRIFSKSPQLEKFLSKSCFWELIL